jgi:hypothetical protein
MHSQGYYCQTKNRTAPTAVAVLCPLRPGGGPVRFQPAAGGTLLVFLERRVGPWPLAQTTGFILGSGVRNVLTGLVPLLRLLRSKQEGHRPSRGADAAGTAPSPDPGAACEAGTEPPVRCTAVFQTTVLRGSRDGPGPAGS